MFETDRGSFHEAAPDEFQGDGAHAEGVSDMKRLIVLAAAAAAAAVAVQRQRKARRAEADLWAQLTDDVPAESTTKARD